MPAATKKKKGRGGGGGKDREAAEHDYFVLWQCTAVIVPVVIMFTARVVTRWMNRVFVLTCWYYYVTVRNSMRS